MTTLVVTEPEYRKAQAVFEQAPGMRCIAAPPQEDLLAEAIVAAGARHAIVGVAPYTGRLYEVLPKGAVLARFGVGHDGIDKARATAAGILCTNTPGTLEQSVAELAITLLLAAARKLPELAEAARAGEWPAPLGVEVGGRTLAVIGTGPIGRRVAEIASRGFGMRVVGCASPRADLGGNPEPFAKIVRDFGEAVREADYVSLHIPATPANHRYVNAERLAQVPAGAWLINTARGAVVDESALYAALAGGRLAGAALDVFAKEPYQPVSPEQDLRTLPNVILLPHVGSATREACDRMARRALENVRAAGAQQWQRMDLLNPEALPVTA